MKNKFIHILGLLILLIFSWINCTAQFTQKDKQISPFRYVIAFNDVATPCKKCSSLRFLTVLMDKEAFTDENLKKLFNLLSSRFPKPLDMSVSVDTDLADILTPEEKETLAVHSEKKGFSYSHSSGAFMIRTEQESVISIYSDSDTLLKRIYLEKEPK